MPIVLSQFRWRCCQGVYCSIVQFGPGNGFLAQGANGGEEDRCYVQALFARDLGNHLHVAGERGLVLLRRSLRGVVTRVLVPFGRCREVFLFFLVQAFLLEDFRYQRRSNGQRRLAVPYKSLQCKWCPKRFEGSFQLPSSGEGGWGGRRFLFFFVDGFSFAFVRASWFACGWPARYLKEASQGRPFVV